MRRSRAAAAVVTLACLVLPGAVALAAAPHLSAHHGSHLHPRGDRTREVDLSVVWHGHSHGPETPDHEHPFLLAGTDLFQFAKSRISPLQPQPALPCGYTTEARSPLASSRPHPLPGVAGVGPPPLHRSPILRI